MKNEDRQLLLRDLCVRLPYKVKASYYGAEEECETWDEVESITTDGYVDIGQYSLPIECIKPYLFPMSSMTEEQKKDFIKVAEYETRDEDCGRHKETYYYDNVGHENELYPNYFAIDWLNAHHFDYRGLIEKGLAIDASGLNIY